MKANGLNNTAGFFASVVQEQQERLTDIPYALVEAVKQEWITENWPYEMFVGRVKNAWEKWRIDFTDEGADRMRWGERIRKLEANKVAALKTYKKLFREESFKMFEDSERARRCLRDRCSDGQQRALVVGDHRCQGQQGSGASG
jgi:hypothetical protein